MGMDNRRAIYADNYSSVSLKYDKVSPRIHKYDYRKHRYAVYMYLDPFQSGNFEYKFMCCGKKQTVKSAYLPVYVGKLEKPLAYRMNQHLNQFVSNKAESENQYKKQFFAHLQKQIENNINSGNPDTMMPRDLDAYRTGWIVIIKTFDTVNELREYERELIKAIGCQFDHSGPLTNKKKGN